jgi:hypothetical protein
MTEQMLRRFGHLFLNGSVELSNQEQPKKKKVPIACAVRRMHEGMEIMFAYDRDKSFLPSPNELMQFELVHKQITGHHAMSLIIIQDMRERAKKWVAEEGGACAEGTSNRLSTEQTPPPTPPHKGEGSMHDDPSPLEGRG